MVFQKRRSKAMEGRSKEQIDEEYKRVTTQIEDLNLELDRKRVLEERLEEIIFERTDLSEGDKVVLDSESGHPLLPIKGGAHENKPDYVFVYSLEIDVSDQGTVRVWAKLCTPDEYGEMPDEPWRYTYENRYKANSLEPYEPQDS